MSAERRCWWDGSPASIAEPRGGTATAADILRDGDASTHHDASRRMHGFLSIVAGPAEYAEARTVSGQSVWIAVRILCDPCPRCCFCHGNSRSRICTVICTAPTDMSEAEIGQPSSA